jgi:CDP-diglyceride synthetase
MPQEKMLKRIIFGAVIIAVVVCVFWLDWRLGDWSPEPRSTDDVSSLSFAERWPAVPILALTLPLLWIGFLEFGRMARTIGIRVRWLAGLVGVTLIAIIPWLYGIDRIHTQQTFIAYTDGTQSTGRAWGPLTFVLNHQLHLFALGLGLIFLGQMIFSRLEDALRRISCTVLGIAYLGFCGAAILSIRMVFGTAGLIIFLASVKCADIGAYFVGSFYGRHKMIPWLSPGKSWEGFFGGLGLSAVVSVVLGLLLSSSLAPLPWWSWAIFGISVGIAGQFGDLCESLLKRSAEVKDSGALVPEFGGVLDIIDSPLLAAPVGYLVLALFSVYL